MNFLEFVRDNLGHVLPVLIAGVIAIAITYERSRALFQKLPMNQSRDFFDKITELVMHNRVPEAIALCEKNGSKPVAQVVKTGLLRSHLPEEAIEQGLAMAVSEGTREIQQRTSYLATIANVATLLGLFGTIAGLIASFEAVAHADAQQKSALLSAGIGAAMNATMLGLGVAIPCMVIYAVLVNKSNKLVADLEDAASRTVDVLKLRWFAPQNSNPTQPGGSTRPPMAS